MLFRGVSSKLISQLLTNGVYREHQVCDVTKYFALLLSRRSSTTIKFKYSCQKMNNRPLPSSLLPHNRTLRSNIFVTTSGISSSISTNTRTHKFGCKSCQSTWPDIRYPSLTGLLSPIVTQHSRKYASESKKEQYYNNKSKSSRTKLYYTLKQYIRSPENAETFVSHLKESERRLLLTALETSIGSNSNAEHGEDAGKITRRQLYLVFVHNCIPFVGFGFLDNAIMILAGEYIDLTIGVTFGISTMAAAAFGNTISDLAGIGLAGYVEMLFYKLGLPVPALTPEQAEQRSTIFCSNAGKAFGIFVGCLIGMFPLFFIDKDEKEDD